ncbi:serine--tRNA ligase [Alphaproteobacteria bacterium]|nr:serine--tRNA ligase [Alphaproteobacteria bacterium]
MLDINFIIENKDSFETIMSNRNIKVSVSSIIELDKEKRKLVASLQELLTERNSISKLIGINKYKKIDTDSLEKKVNLIKEKIPSLEKEVNLKSDKLNNILLGLPNFPDEDVPVGKDEKSNKKISTKGNIKKFDFEPLSHDILGSKNNMMDFEAASDISGARYVILKSDLAKLERALSNFMIDLHVNEHSYVEVSTPHIVKSEALIGTGQLPKFKKDLFSVDNEKWLIPTAEVTLTNLSRKTIILNSELPIRYVAHTNCFRSEAGAAGKDTKGMIRLHEFKKVELVSLVEKKNSNIELDRLVRCASKVLDLLRLPYRIVLLSTGDMGFSASKTFDIEVWLPSQNTYREISSCSNCTDFQSRRMQTKYKDQDGKKHYLHTLNGSGLAVGRTLLAIMENYQLDNKRIKVPEVLEKYMGGQKEISI